MINVFEFIHLGKYLSEQVTFKYPNTIHKFLSGIVLIKLFIS